MGISGKLPPPGVPLGLLGAAGVGLIAFGVAVAFRPQRAIDGPMSLDVVSVVHLAMLAFLSTAMLGALHQFVPVITSAELRSKRVAVVTAPIWLVGVWLLPLGFALNSTPVIVTAAILATTSAYVVVWNLSGPLSKKAESDSVVGLRSSVSFFAITVSFGFVYAANLHHGWFGLFAHRVLAHAMLGLLGWIGTGYVSVAERLWPMFLLSHKKQRGAGAFAVRLLPAGVAVLATGLLFAWKAVAIAGGVVTASGLLAHLASLVGYLRLRRRKIETLQWFVILSAVFLLAAMVLGSVAGLAPMSVQARSHVASAFVAALLMWLCLAIVGHSHKIVPFIVWTRMRSKGKQRKPDGKAILFGDLSNATAGWASLALTTIGGVSLIVGLLLERALFVTSGGAALAVSGLTTLTNLTVTPIRVARSVTAEPNRTAIPRIPVKIETAPKTEDSLKEDG